MGQHLLELGRAMGPVQGKDDAPYLAEEQEKSMRFGSDHTVPAALQEQLSTMKKEIDALQIEVAKPATPWYRQASVVIAVLALVFSFLTTYYSNHRTQLQDVHNAKIELRQIMQQLQDLTTVSAEYLDKYKNRPQVLGSALSMARTQQILLASQAADVIDEIPDDVGSTEYAAVAEVLATVDTSQRVYRYYERAIARAQDRDSYFAALRGLASVYYRVGDLEKGRSTYSRAVADATSGPWSNAAVASKMNVIAYTELLWSTAELNAKQCGLAVQHYEKSKKLYNELELREGWDVGYIKPQLNALHVGLNKRC
jgi:tetratricopeptide (TPR) repeat protein